MNLDWTFHCRVTTQTLNTCFTETTCTSCPKSTQIGCKTFRWIIWVPYEFSYKGKIVPHGTNCYLHKSFTVVTYCSSWCISRSTYWKSANVCCFLPQIWLPFIATIEYNYSDIKNGYIRILVALGTYFIPSIHLSPPCVCLWWQFVLYLHRNEPVFTK